MHERIRSPKTRWLGFGVMAALLIAFVGWPTASYSARRSSSINLSVQKATLSKKSVPYGTTAFQISGGRVNYNEMFGPAVTTASPKKGNQFLVLKVNIKERSDKKWKKLIGSAHLLDTKDSKYKMVLWFYKGAYRASGLLGFAKGVKSIRDIELIYHIPDPLPDGLKLKAGEKEIADISTLLAGQTTAPSSLEIKEGTSVYGMVNWMKLRIDPAASSKGTGTEFPFGQELNVEKNQENWLLVNMPGTSNKGWVHRSAVSFSKDQVAGMKEIDAVPKAILFIYNIKGSASFKIAIIVGSIKLGDKRVLAEHGTCLVFNEEKALSLYEQPLRGLGVDQTIVSPKPWTLYFYCSNEKMFRPVPELITEAKKLIVGPHRPEEPSVFKIKTVSNWPSYSGKLKGENTVRIVNPNDYNIKVGLRSNGKGIDFDVAKNATKTVYVPNGHYEIYFQYSTEKDALYQGDNFTLANNGIEIQIVKVAGGNYSIRKIK